MCLCSAGFELFEFEPLLFDGFDELELLPLFEGLEEGFELFELEPLFDGLDELELLLFEGLEEGLELLELELFLF